MNLSVLSTVRKSLAVDDDEALEAAFRVETRLEGIIPALEAPMP